MKRFKLIDLLDNVGINTFLIDAMGVIYNDKGLIPGAAAAINKFKSIGKIFIVTNNTTNNPTQIAAKISRFGAKIEPVEVVSSGFGLAYDKKTNEMVKDKAVYVFGREDCYSYFERAKVRKIVYNLKDAEVVVLTATLEEGQEEFFADFKKELANFSGLPIICANPDIFVMSAPGVERAVIGYYAKILEEAGHTVHWIGKPFPNFLRVVGNILNDRGISLGKDVCFFDDNVKNVLAMQEVLGISGCVVTDTGLSKYMDLETEFKLKTNRPDYLINSLTV
jgi:HAD superfamily hydrolase (TIGR01450 family)